MTDTQKKWEERVRAWRGSGLTAAEFSRERGFATTSLWLWSSRLGRGAESRRLPARESSAVRLAKVIPVASLASLWITVGPARIEVRRGFDRTLLREVVDA
jgi:hypothetical protein